MWLLIGVFASKCNKQVRIFTDDPSSFSSKLSDQTGKLRANIEILSCPDVASFSVQDSINPWLSMFDNQEVLSGFEIQQLNIILRKFIKQVVTSKMPSNLEKLLNIS